MMALFRISVAEILSSVGWVVLLAAVAILWISTPLISGAHGEGIVISRGQGACLGIFLAGIYCIMLAGKLGAAQVSRGANLYYRAFGISEVARWLGICGACLVPLVFVSLVSGVLLLWNYWAWNSDFVGGLATVLQFLSLTLLRFWIVISLTVGAGALFGYGPGVMSGFALLVIGSLFPQLLSIATKNSPGLEGLWAFLPHLYAIDWSNSVIYLWRAAGMWDYLTALFYGLAWLLAIGVGGLFFFSKSKNQHD
jgi:hypothetical protein